MPSAEARRYPDPEINGVEWFYVFGKQGNTWYGAEREPRVFFVQLPKQAAGSVTVTVLDADIHGAHDEMAGGSWDTSTKFSVFGGSQLLETRTVTTAEPDGTVLQFGPFTLSQGEDQGQWVQFRLEVEGLEGNDNNLFAFDIEPAEAEFYAYNPAVRLAEHEGTRMRFFPVVPSGTSRLRAWNYDLDPTGGNGVMLAPMGSAWLPKMYRVKNSGSAAWASTDLMIPSALSGTRWTYQVTKATQPRGNMSMRFEDQAGRPLPVYFLPGEIIQVAGPPPKPVPPTAGEPVRGSCNTFEFDASQSYDPDKQALTYRWEFGDGAFGDQMRMRHTYDKPGEYRVVLTVTDTSTAACRQSQQEQRINVNGPPTAVLEAPPTACAGTPIRLSAAKSSDASGDALRYTWELGDGTTAEGAEVTHTYAKGGTYQVRLLVDDQRDTSCSRAQTASSVRVNTPPIVRTAQALDVCLKNPLEPLEVLFDASNSHDPDGQQLAYRWEFGDGATGEGAKVSHMYQRGGSYTARLTVDDGSDSGCALATASIPVRINRAPLALAEQQITTCAGTTVTLDASRSSDADGDRLTYTWDLGDGTTATGAQVAHQYTKGGTYRARVTVDDGSGMQCASSTAMVTALVNQPPRAVAKADDTGCSGRTMTFDASASADPDGQKLTYAWDFGDGATATGAKVQHAYAKGGRYPLTLTVDDGSGTACQMAIARGEVRINTPPVADAGPNVICCWHDMNTFDASKSHDPDGDALVFQWNFGDGATAEGARVQHAFEKFGNYPVRVTVRDTSGIDCGSATASFLANVNAPPVAQMAIRGEGLKPIPATAGEAEAREQ